jgi:hypothetical protein
MLLMLHYHRNEQNEKEIRTEKDNRPAFSKGERKKSQRESAADSSCREPCQLRKNGLPTGWTLPDDARHREGGQRDHTNFTIMAKGKVSKMLLPWKLLWQQTTTAPFMTLFRKNTREQPMPARMMHRMKHWCRLLLRTSRHQRRERE